MPKITDIVPVSLPSLSLYVRFDDDTARVFDMKCIEESDLYQALKSNMNLFRSAQLIPGAVYWNDDLDLAQSFIYQNSRVV
jgi:hypothetical protein